MTSSRSSVVACLASFGPAIAFVLVLVLASEQGGMAAWALTHQITWLVALPVNPAYAPLLLAAVVAGFLFMAKGVMLGLRHRRPDGMAVVNAALIMLFGGASLWFSPETFQRWQPSVIFWSFGVGIWLAQLLAGRNVLRLLLGQHLTLSAPGWHGLNFVWVAFFGMMGLAHLWAAYSLSPSAWDTFKYFGGPGLTLLFALAQAGLFGLRLHLNATRQHPQ